MRTALSRAAPLLQLLILAAPSVLLIAQIPPFWRDVDAYVQTVFPPSPDTLLLHGPLYCSASRLPLWLGYLWSGAGPAMPLRRFIDHSQLTDAGVWLLIVVQHAMFIGAAAFLIFTVTRSEPARFALCAFLATLAPLYAFAHCVGSESGSLIITIFCVAYGLRILRSYPRVKPTSLVYFTALLCCAILTRRVNVLLALALPSAIAFAVLLLPQLGWPRRARIVLVTAVAIALASTLWASAFNHLLCWKMHVPWRPKLGFTFVWRLNFLADLDPADRQRLLAATAAKPMTADSRIVVAALEQWLATHSEWEPDVFAREATKLFPPVNNKVDDYRSDQALNGLAHALLIPPGPALIHAAQQDSLAALRLSSGDLTDFLFDTTQFLSSRIAPLPQLAHLKRFTSGTEPRVPGLTSAYLRLWARVSAWQWILLTAIVTLAAASRDRAVRGDATYATILLLLGVAFTVATCFCAQLQPRFILPMITSTWIALLIAIGACVNAARPAHGGRSAATTSSLATSKPRR